MKISLENLKMNQQNLFLSKSLKRPSQNQADSRSFKRFGSSITAKSNVSSHHASPALHKGNSYISKYHNQLNALHSKKNSYNSLIASDGQIQIDKKPVFRINSISQNYYNTTQNTEEKEETEINRNKFKYEMVIGKGGFGKVWIVEHKASKKYYALKEMSKAKVISKRSVQSVLNERTLLNGLIHNFIVNMKWAFQDRDNLYLVMDLLTGGDLRFHICLYRKFTEEMTKFFTACIIQGLECLHEKSILHRDIKPENLVFEENGYIRITDLGIARKWGPDNHKETSGTPGYMAPEVMCRQNHGLEVDFFALGVIVYECMMGKRPYLGRSRKEIRDQIQAKQVKIREEEIPKNWSIEAADFCNRLIQRKPIRRQGTNGIGEVKAHPWLKDFPWEKQARKQLEPPFKPNTKNVFDYAKNQSEENTNPNENMESVVMLRRKSVQEMFKDYHFENKNLTPRPSSRKPSSKLPKSNSIKIRSLNSSIYMDYNNHGH